MKIEERKIDGYQGESKRQKSERRKRRDERKIVVDKCLDVWKAETACDICLCTVYTVIYLYIKCLGYSFTLFTLTVLAT